MNIRKYFIKFLIILIIAFSYSQTFAALPQKKAITLTAEEKEWINQNHTVRIFIGDWPPYTITDGDFSGICVDYAERIFEINGINYQYVSEKKVPWHLVFEDIKHHRNIDLILAANNTPERRTMAIFTQGYIESPWVVFSRNDSPFISGVRGSSRRFFSP